MLKSGQKQTKSFECLLFKICEVIIEDCTLTISGNLASVIVIDSLPTNLGAFWFK